MIDRSGEIHNGRLFLRKLERRHGNQAYEAKCLSCGRVIKGAYYYLQHNACPCNRAKQYIYMAVTSDAYELPVAVADTIEELAQQTGYKESRIRFAVTPSGSRRYGKGNGNGTLRFFRVERDDACEAALQT